MTEHPRSGEPLHPSPETAPGGSRASADDSGRTDRSSSKKRSDTPAFGAGVEPGQATKAPARRKKAASRRSTAAAKTDEEGSSRATPAKRRRRRSSAAASEPAEKPAAKKKSAAKKADASPDEGRAAAEGESRPRRRSRRGGRRGSKRGATKAEATETQAEANADAKAEQEPVASEKPATAKGEDAPKRGRRRGKRGGRRRRRSEPEALEIEAIPGEVDELPDLADLPEEAVLLESEEAGGGRKKRARKRKTEKKAPEKRVSLKKSSRRKAVKKTSSRGKKRGSRADDEAVPEAVPEEDLPRQLILVNSADPEETRVAVVEEGRLIDLQMTALRHSSYVNDIYRARVVNLESAIGAAFVDFGQGRNGFLHASDVLPEYGESDWKLEKLLTTQIDSDEFDESADEADDGDDGDAEEAPAKKSASSGKRGRGAKGRRSRSRKGIDQLLKKGQHVVVQVTKDAIGDKGPTLTTYISIPGRYLVLMPSLARTGVSRKIEDERERKRLKRILGGLEIPDGMGVIVRTAGVGKKKEEIKRDLETLLLAWEDFGRRLKSGSRPTPLYQESDAAVRTMRDLFTSRTEKVIVDDKAVHARMVEFTTRLMPEHVDRIVFHDGPRPLFHTYGVEQDFEKMFARRHELPSGGSIVIDETEALVSIDVNSGKTRQEGAEFEDIALKTNLEAAREITRQLRLRDLGGIIVLDFIDMMRPASRRKVEQALRDHMSRDRARSKIGRISQFGLLEMTRQRLGPGLTKMVHSNCPTCRGTGRRRTDSSRAQAILRRLGAAMTLKGFTSVEVGAHDDVIAYMKANLKSELKELEEGSGRSISLLAKPDQVEDSVLHYLRADGREVRPGGRRKR
jgi:ribonuclease E